jgi:NAD(P)-dependent dehydrogenase (short-subunit alcohol dehydrogenase family)
MSNTQREEIAGELDVVCRDGSNRTTHPDRGRHVQSYPAGKGKAVVQRFDALDGEQINTLMERGMQEFGGIDGLHFNAADQ